MKRWDFERAVLRSDLSATARLILLALAVVADWPGGAIPPRFTPSLTTLAEMTGLSRSALAKYLNEIEQTGDQDGWVVRVRPTKERARSDKERTRYQLSVPSSARDALASPRGALASAQDGLELVHETDWASAPGGHKPDPSRPLPDRSQAAEQIVIEATGATAEEATAIARRVENERKPRNLPGLLRRMAADGDLAQFLTDQRAATTRARNASAIAKAREGPQCEHGEAGGANPHPSSGEPLCPQCRALARRAALKVVSR